MSLLQEFEKKKLILQFFPITFSSSFNKIQCVCLRIHAKNTLGFSTNCNLCRNTRKMPIPFSEVL